MIQFLPKNLSIENMLAEFPPTFTHHPDNFKHILSLLTEIPGKSPDSVNKKGFVSLNATLLKKRFYNYRQHLDYLLERGVIESDRWYVPGRKSKGYRFTEKYRTEIVPVEITKYTLTKSIKARGSYDRHMRAKYDYLYNHVDERLQIDFNSAQKYLKERFWKDREQKVQHAWQKYNTRLAVLFRLHHKQHYFRVDETSGRLHTNLTTLKKELRDFITFDGKPLTAVDISCSQPSLSTVLLNPAFYAENDSDIVRIHQIAPGIADILPLTEIKQLVDSEQTAFNLYKHAVQNDLYEWLRPHLESITGREWSNRKELKSLMFTVLYSDNRFMHQKEALPKRLFRELFPEVYQVFSLIKRKDASTLPILLQKMEVKLVLDTAAKKFSKQYPGAPILSVHDSLASYPEYEPVLTTILKEEAKRLFQLNVNTNKEEWGFNIMKG